MERFAGRALGEREATEPLCGQRRRATRTDSFRPPVAELVAVEGVGQVQVLGTGRRRCPPQRFGQIGGRPIRRPVGISVPDRAPPFGQSTPPVLRVPEPATLRERRRVARRDEPVVGTRVAVRPHHPPHPMQSRGDSPRGIGKRFLDARLRFAMAGGRFVFRAPRPIERAFGDQVSEPDIVGADRHHDHPHLVPPCHRRQLIGLRRLAEVRGTAFVRGPEVTCLGAGAGQVHPLVHIDRRAHDRRDVGAVTVVRLTRPVDAGGVIFATQRTASVGGAIGSRPRPERFGSVAQPAAALARDEAVTDRDDRGRSGDRRGGEQEEDDRGEAGDPHGRHTSGRLAAGQADARKLARRSLDWHTVRPSVTGRGGRSTEDAKTADRSRSARRG